MFELTEDAKVIAASNLTLAFFIREHTLVSLGQIKELNPDNDVVENFFKKFKDSLDK